MYDNSCINKNFKLLLSFECVIIPVYKIYKQLLSEVCILIHYTLFILTPLQTNYLHPMIVVLQSLFNIKHYKIIILGMYDNLFIKQL